MHKRYTVRRCDDGTSLVNGPDHTWDVVDRVTGNVVSNTDTRIAARADARSREEGR